MLATTSYASIIRPLQILVIVVAGLFFARIIRVVMVEVRPPDDEGRVSRRRRRGALGLEFIEPLDREGERVDVESYVTVGRSNDCELPLSDTYLSSRHARFTMDAGDLLVEDLGSTNGTYVNQELIDDRTLLQRGDIVQVGGVLFEVVR